MRLSLRGGLEYVRQYSTPKASHCRTVVLSSVLRITYPYLYTLRGHTARPYCTAPSSTAYHLLKLFWIVVCRGLTGEGSVDASACLCVCACVLWVVEQWVPGRVRGQNGRRARVGGGPLPGDRALLLQSCTRSAAIAVPSQGPIAIFCPLNHHDTRFSILLNARELRGIDSKGEGLRSKGA